MAIRILLVLALLWCAGCATPPKEKPKPKTVKADPAAFHAFVSRVRDAVTRRDLPLLASLMTPNFGYRMEPVGEGAGVFQYWDENGLWGELVAILDEPFVPNGSYMVAPPQFATDPQYHGYRAGFIEVNGVWKFAYFVSG